MILFGVAGIQELVVPRTKATVIVAQKTMINLNFTVLSDFEISSFFFSKRIQGLRIKYLSQGIFLLLQERV